MRYEILGMGYADAVKWSFRQIRVACRSENSKRLISEVLVDRSGNLPQTHFLMPNHLIPRDLGL